MHLHDGKAARKAETKYKQVTEPLSEDEIDLMVGTANIAIMNAENVFYQYQLGLFEEEEWLAWRSSMKWMLSTLCFESFYERNRAWFREGFAAEIDGLYLELAQTDCPLNKRE